MILLFDALIASEDGQDLVEYALLASFVSLTVMAAVIGFGGSVGDLATGVFGRAITAVLAALR